MDKKTQKQIEEMLDELTSLRVTKRTRNEVMKDKLELGLKTVDDVILLYRNTHILHNRRKNENS